MRLFAGALAIIEGESLGSGGLKGTNTPGTFVRGRYECNSDISAGSDPQFTLNVEQNVALIRNPLINATLDQRKLLAKRNAGSSHYLFWIISPIVQR